MSSSSRKRKNGLRPTAVYYRMPIINNSSIIPRKEEERRQSRCTETPSENCTERRQTRNREREREQEKRRVKDLLCDLNNVLAEKQPRGKEIARRRRRTILPNIGNNKMNKRERNSTSGRG